MYHYNFFLSGYKLKNGKQSILIKYYENWESRIHVKTGLTTSNRFWNQEKGFLKKSKEIDTLYSELVDLDKLARNIIDSYEKENTPLSNKLFKTKFQNREYTTFSQANDFFSELDSYIEDKKPKVTKDVIKDYNSLKKHLEGYEEFTKETITFKTMSFTFYEKWTNYLAYEAPLKTGGKGMKNNTVGKLVKNLKAFLNDRMRKNRIKDIDLSQFKVVQEEVDHIYLSNKEIELIFNVDCSDDAELEKVKDFFVIGCLTGLRFSDIIRIRREHIDHNNFLSLRQKKTFGKIVVPLRPKVIEVLSKYDWRAPQIDSFTFNRRIKDLGEEAELNQLVEIEHKRGTIRESKFIPKYDLISSHTCRRSFCTNAYLDGIDTHLIMQISGHKTEKAFKRYLKISKLEAAEKLKAAWGL